RPLEVQSESQPSRKTPRTLFKSRITEIAIACYSSVRAQGIDDLQAREVSFVFGDDHAIIRFSDCGDDHVEWAPGPPFRSAVGHQPCPDQAGFFVEREDAAG